MNLLHQCRAEFSGKTLRIFSTICGTNFSWIFSSFSFVTYALYSCFERIFLLLLKWYKLNLIGWIYNNWKTLSHPTKAALHTTDVAFLLHLPPLQWQNGTRHACVFEALALFFFKKKLLLGTNRTVILFNNRYLLSAKSICPTLKINVPVVYMVQDVMILNRAISITRGVGRDGPWNWDFFGPWNGNEQS
jgi:hypothetical protein